MERQILGTGTCFRGYVEQNFETDDLGEPADVASLWLCGLDDGREQKHGLSSQLGRKLRLQVVGHGVLRILSRGFFFSVVGGRGKYYLLRTGRRRRTRSLTVEM